MKRTKNLQFKNNIAKRKLAAQFYQDNSISKEVIYFHYGPEQKIGYVGLYPMVQFVDFDPSTDLTKVKWRLYCNFDDTWVDQNFDSKEEAMKVYDQIEFIPDWETLIKGYGFNWSA